LFHKCRRWLRPGGVFCFADQFCGVAEDVYQKHIANWRQLSMEAGSTEEEWQMWVEHQKAHDYHDPLPEELAWITQAGFNDVDCVWRYLLWAVVQGRV
jgi:tRNA (cmo5U34)-methyltransferase